MARRLILPVLLIAVLLTSTLALYTLVTSRYRFLVWDFHQLWSGTRAILLHGENPYSEAVTERIEVELHGHPLPPNESVVGFFYPLYTAYLIAPVALLPYALAEAAWFSLLELAIVIGIVAGVAALGWKPQPALLVGLVIGSGMLYPVTWSFILGQISLFVLALLALTLWAVRRRRDGWAGILLALTTVKPQMAFLIVPALLIWAVARRRWRIVGGFSVTLGLLLLSSLVWLLTWIGDFVAVSSRYYQTVPFPPPVQLLTEWCGSRFHALAAWLLAALLLTIVGWSWWRAIRNAEETIHIACGLTLAATTLVAPRTSQVNQVLLVLPLLFLLYHLWQRGAGGRIIGLAFFLLMLIGPWAVRAASRIPQGLEGYAIEHRLISPILPVATWLALLVWLALRRES